MQSYEEHPVSEFLLDRHPYLQDPFSRVIDKNQVTLAVFDRKIEKLAACLTYSDLSDERRRDTLITLNEMVAHQETKDDMISAGILQSCGVLLHSDNWEVRRYSALLTGGLISVMQGRVLMIESEVFPGLQEKLTDDVLEVREAVAWTLCRLANSRDGVEIMVESNTIPSMVGAFIQYADPRDVVPEWGQYLLYLLEGFVNLTEYDNGIEPVLGTGLMASLANLIVQSKKVKPHRNVIVERTLHVIANISMNPTGKQEGVDEEVIKLCASPFINPKKTYEQRRLGCSVIMSVTILLAGKKQTVADKKIVKNLFKLLQGVDEDIRINAKQCLINISDLPAGIEMSVDTLSKDLMILDELYQQRAVKPLSTLLPKLSAYEKAPKVDKKKSKKYKRFVKALAYLINKYDQAVIEAIDTVNIATKLGPFLSKKYKADKHAAGALQRVVAKDAHNKQLLTRFVLQHGETTKIAENLAEKYPSLDQMIKD